jgi:ribose 1,5-bisphosphate isomerase
VTTPPAWWPTTASSCFEDLVAYRLVGASACADRITASLVLIARESQERRRDLRADLADAARLLCALKPDTALYRNVVDALGRAGATGRARDVESAAGRLTSYRSAAQVRVVNRTQTLLEAADTLLVHDYSSMVERILRGLGAVRPRRVVVTVGEPLGQGPRVARLAAAAGHEVTYTPDMSVARVIDDVDFFVTGVESFYLDGSLANTVGTTMLALLCREAKVPVVAPAETLKCDLARSSVSDAPLTAQLLHPWPPDACMHDVDEDKVVRFVLDAVPALLITTYVTETDTCEPTNVGALARRTASELQDGLTAQTSDAQ